MLKHLNNIFLNPLYAWKEIDKDEYASPWILIKENLAVYLLINPLLFFLVNLILFTSFKKLILHGIFYPFFLTFVSIIIIIFLGLLLEEIYRITSFRDPQQNIFKLLVFSSLPFYSLSGFYDIPWIGKVLFVTGIAYSLYVLKAGFEKFLWVNKSSRRQIFLISSIFSIILLTVLSGILLVLLNAVKDYMVRKIF